MKSGKVLSVTKVVMLPPAVFGGLYHLIGWFPRTQERGCCMEWNDVFQLFVVIGGTVVATFQISWAIFKEIHNNKK